MISLLKTRHRLVSICATAVQTAFRLSVVYVGLVASATASVPPQSTAELSVARTLQFAIADFDGDNRPDLASVEFVRSGPLNYAINFRLTSGPRRSIDIAAPEGGLRLRAQDVNGDSFPDVVVTTFWTDRPVAILLNDGRGNFTRSEPSAFPGAFGDSGSSHALSEDTKASAPAALFSRYSSGQLEESGAATWLQNPVGYVAATPCYFLSPSICNSSSGRAPPAVVAHS